MLTLVSERPTAGHKEVAVTLRVELSREQLTAALYNMPDPDSENLATAALVRSEIACALMSGSGTPDDLAHTGRWTRRAYADGQLATNKAAWWALCWRRVGEVFFSGPDDGLRAEWEATDPDFPGMPRAALRDVVGAMGQYALMVLLESGLDPQTATGVKLSATALLEAAVDGFLILGTVGMQRRIEQAQPWELGADGVGYVRLTNLASGLVEWLEQQRAKPVTRLAQLRAERGWKKARVIKALRAVAVRLDGADLAASDESLSRQLSAWEHGHRPLGEFYRRLFAAVYGVPAWQLETTIRPESSAPAQLRPVRPAAPPLALVAAEPAVRRTGP